MQIGTAWRVINNQTGRLIQGASVDNVAESIRDDCEANALFLKSETTSVLWGGCDLAIEAVATARSGASSLGHGFIAPGRCRGNDHSVGTATGLRHETFV